MNWDESKDRLGAIAAVMASRVQILGQGRTARNLAGFVLFLGLATSFSSDQAPRGVVAKASAIPIGEARVRTDAFDPFARPASGIEKSQNAAIDIARDLGASLPEPAAAPRDPIAIAFAAVEFGTRDMPALRSSLDDSFAMVAVASRGQDALERAAARQSVPVEMTAAPMLPSLFAGAFPRSKPAAPADEDSVRTASIAPDDGGTTLLRNRKTLDLDSSAGLPRLYPKGSAPYLDIIAREAKANGVPLWVALGVIWVESKYNPKLRGSHGVLGMMQVMPSTARYIGYKGSNDALLEAETNIIWGMKELGKDYKLANGDLCLTIAKYTGGFMTKRVRPAAQRYCNEVRRVTGMT